MRSDCRDQQRREKERQRRAGCWQSVGREHQGSAWRLLGSGPPGSLDPSASPLPWKATRRC